MDLGEEKTIRWLASILNEFVRVCVCVCVSVGLYVLQLNSLSPKHNPSQGTGPCPNPAARPSVRTHGIRSHRRKVTSRSHNPKSLPPETEQSPLSDPQSSFFLAFSLVYIDSNMGGGVASWVRNWACNQKLVGLIP
ncbi:hypothetical protein ANANG_G00054510, partial [Anguilla anguilla]